ncbi:TetR/AcrR family transcriptional regulator [Agromyces aureus]|uniref:HTH tetR-type domain-containing protein n=1 Tax=Agromyces aureus TaxID=453304 RepID=A0A191WHP1_9MICO|nr:TetR/AcrR family transcriptional regulator [Agromyces aureus]ANJ27776.1 hypothetical protein ATC03_14725 [Agromyces aureus]
MPRVSDSYRAKRLDDLYRATWRCVAEIGLQRMTITDIITESGFSAGMVYNYFGGKDELVDAAQIEAIARARAALDVATSRPSAGPDELFERTLRAFATRPDAGDNALLALWSMNASERSSPEARVALAAFARSTRERFADQALGWPRSDGRAPTRAHALADAELLESVILGFFAQQRFGALDHSPPLLSVLRSARRHRLAIRRLWAGR